jgi:RNA polymerase sigma-32 factor
MRTHTIAFPILTTECGVTHYLEEIKRFPMLESQEEYMLAKRRREYSDHDAAHRLVTSHLRLVAKIARGYRGYGLPISEMISEGNFGLIQAVKRLGLNSKSSIANFALSSYAIYAFESLFHETGFVRKS